MRRVRYAVIAFFLVYLAAVTWPAGTLFSAPEPFVLGLPFSLFWPVLWIVLGFGALVALYRADEARRRGGDG